MGIEPLERRVPTTTSGRIRGAALREFLCWYERHHQDTTHRLGDRVIASDGGSPVFMAGLPAFGVLSSRWYDANDVHALLDMLAAEGRAEEIALSGGRAVMRRTLSGVFRAMVRFLVNPERYAANAHRIWDYYYDHGEFVVMDRGEGCAVTTVRGWNAHHRMLCDMNVAAAAVIYETIGCPNVTVRRLACVDEGASSCQYQVDWTRPHEVKGVADI